MHALKNIYLLGYCRRSKEQKQKQTQNLEREDGDPSENLLFKETNTYFCPLGPNPSSPCCAWPQLMQEASAPTKWCILPESMQRIFQPL